ncbi:MAG: hypothetical protein ACTSRG_05475 [Candidatus Helarchaeota archaeon]
MARRVITKKERLKRAEERRKMLQSFFLCLFISLILVIIYLIIFIPMAANYTNMLLNPFCEFFFGGDGFLLFFRGLVLAKVGIITLADVLTSILMSSFFAFLFIGIANLTEYKRRIAGIIEIIFTISGTLLLTLIYAFASGSAVMTVFTGLGSFLAILYLYAIQS